jgi:hypothetical protein
MTQLQRQFHLEEFKALQSQVDGTVKYHHDMMRFALAASAALFAWLATHRPEVGLGVTAVIDRVWYLPAGVAIFSLMGSAALYLRVHEINIYIRKLESSLGTEDLGWQWRNAGRPGILGMAALIFWIALYIVDWMVPALIF